MVHKWNIALHVKIVSAAYVYDCVRCVLMIYEANSFSSQVILHIVYVLIGGKYYKH